MICKLDAVGQSPLRVGKWQKKRTFVGRTPVLFMHTNNSWIISSHASRDSTTNEESLPRAASNSEMGKIVLPIVI